MADDPRFSNVYGTLDTPAELAFAITPGTSDLTRRTRALYVGTGGVVVVEMSGVEVVFPNVQDGTILPIRADKVLATQAGSPGVDTTASDIVGLY